MSDLIKREDVLNVLRMFGWTPIDGLYLVVKQDIPSADRPQEWIPCSERLPSEEKATFLVCTDSEHMCSCRWTNTNPIWTDLTTEWHWCIFDIPQYSKVVAWMPLKPWKGADDDIV